MQKYGQIVGLVLDVAANPITKLPGSTLTIGLNYSYSGPAQTIQAEVYITYDQWWDHFDKVGGARVTVNINQVASAVNAPFSASISGIGFDGVAPGKTYGLLVRFYGDLEGTGVRNWVEWGNRACINLAKK